jgi:hypothetical protein
MTSDPPAGPGKPAPDFAVEAVGLNKTYKGSRRRRPAALIDVSIWRSPRLAVRPAGAERAGKSPSSTSWPG